MRRWIEIAITGFFATVALTIIYVKAGAGKNGASGGQQTAQIISAGGNSLSQVAHALEGN